MTVSTRRVARPAASRVTVQCGVSSELAAERVPAVEARHGAQHAPERHAASAVKTVNATPIVTAATRTPEVGSTSG